MHPEDLLPYIAAFFQYFSPVKLLMLYAYIMKGHMQPAIWTHNFIESACINVPDENSPEFDALVEENVALAFICKRDVQTLFNWVTFIHFVAPVMINLRMLQGITSFVGLNVDLMDNLLMLDF